MALLNRVNWPGIAVIVALLLGWHWLGSCYTGQRHGEQNQYTRRVPASLYAHMKPARRDRRAYCDSV